jgi:Fe2+ or Zn2+ uptake regulation protein
MSDTPQWTDLSDFQRDLLEVILDAADRDDPQSGQDLRRELEAHREETINHGRLYPNLDELTARGLVDCQEIDGRTNGYTPTVAAIELYCEHDERTSRIAAQYDIESERSALVAEGGEPTDDTQYILTDAADEPIEGEEYDTPDAAIDARARLMATHMDGDDVTVEEIDE